MMLVAAQLRHAQSWAALWPGHAKGRGRGLAWARSSLRGQDLGGWATGIKQVRGSTLPLSTLPCDVALPLAEQRLSVRPPPRWPLEPSQGPGPCSRAPGLGADVPGPCVAPAPLPPKTLGPHVLVLHMFSRECYLNRLQLQSKAQVSRDEVRGCDRPIVVGGEGAGQTVRTLKGCRDPPPPSGPQSPQLPGAAGCIVGVAWRLRPSAQGSP